MVKHHRSTGAPRHFRKNQRKHYWPTDYSGRSCATCDFRGRASGDRKGGSSRGTACFNKKSRHYMQLVRGGDSCQHYKLRMEKHKETL